MAWCQVTQVAQVTQVTQVTMLPSGTDGLPRGYSVLGSQVGTSSGWFQSYMYITCILYVYNIICTHIIMWKIMLCINSEDQRMSSERPTAWW